ncbi:MAG: flagellar hook-basal body complex protein FliE [Alphaproteobacteria bacterium]|jgi:flagellar hook-basal body complex protein FliE|nr:flagellar hook-basal body complex protein FliE [Alphaproteobacteria bacterium]MEA2975444.1 flagellar hook-basal body complex protein FliE [Alphaproteobacteria bacterium]
MPTAAIAANAYASLARLGDPSAGLAKAMGGEHGGPNFGSLLKDAMSAVTEAGHKSDLQAQSMAAGKANIVDVVTAVAETEVAVNALVSVRDKVVQAYEEIMRMPI